MACLVLTGIHVYLGVHVIARKVIFVDLALAQIAALGTVTAILLGYEVGKDSTSIYLYSLAFTIFGAFIFSITRMKGEKVPHEAFIGIVYAVTFATTILILAHSPLGPQELDHIIKGELLWVQGDVVIKTASIYALVGIFHFLFRKKFMAISFDPAKAEESGIPVRGWDFLFYMSFGFVITSSVAIAGVFLVFSYLVIPAVGAMLLSDKLGTRLAIGWVGGSIISFIGVKLSWQTGLPTSPLIVCVLAIALILSGITHYIRTSRRRRIALRNLAGAAAVVGLFIFAVFAFKKKDEDPYEHALHLFSSKVNTDRVTAMNTIAYFIDKRSEWLPLVRAGLRDKDATVRKASIELLSSLKDSASSEGMLELLDDKSDEVRRSVILAIRSLGGRKDADVLLKHAEGEEDGEMRLLMLTSALELGDADAIPPLLAMIEADDLFSEDAYHDLQPHIPIRFKRNETNKVRSWFVENQRTLIWDANSKLFVTKQ